MNLYKIFVKKEAKEIISHKKSLMFLFLFMLYPAVLNAIEKDPILPMENIMPLFFLFSVCFPSDFIYTIMNHELDDKTYDILFISKINRLELLFSKITIPIIMGLINMIASLLINHFLLFIFKPKTAYYEMTNINNILFLSLSLVFSCLLAYTIFNIARTKISRQIYTAFLTIELLFLAIIYQLMKSNIVWCTSLIFLDLLLIVINVFFIKKYEYLNKQTTYRSIGATNQNVVLLKNAFKHTINSLPLACLIIFENIIIICLKVFVKNNIVLILLFVIINVANNNLLVFKKQIIDRENKINEIFFVAKNTSNNMMLYDLLLSFLINQTILVTTIIGKEFVLLHILYYELYLVFCVILYYFVGKIIDLRFNKQINTIITIMVMIISSLILIKLSV